MRYLITYTTEFGLQQSYFSNNFVDVDFNSDSQMIVFDLENNLYKVNACGWAKIDLTETKHKK